MKQSLARETQWLRQEKYHGAETPQLAKDIARLRQGEHIDYVIGFVEFAGCVIDLAHKPLIPRSETEYWAKKAIEDIQKGIHNTQYEIQVLDMFAGSGCIGVAVLKHILQARVDFGEKQKPLLLQIRLNAKKNGIEKTRYRGIHSDVFSRISGIYDYIFANPPYIPEGRKKRLPKSVVENEPSEALFGGKDGLLYISRFLKEAKKHLKPQGKIFLEFDSSQKNAINRLLKEFGYATWQFFKDQYARWRFVVIS